MITYYPTFHCFDDCLDFITALLDAGMTGLDERMVIVHALCTTPGGEVFAHGWVEDEDEGIAIHAVLTAPDALETRIWLSMPIAEYRDAMKVQDFTRYTLAEAYAENRRTESFGPWVERYLPFCANGDRKTWTLNVTEKGEG